MKKQVNDFMTDNLKILQKLTMARVSQLKILSNTLEHQENFRQEAFTKNSDKSVKKTFVELMRILAR